MTPLEDPQIIESLFNHPPYEAESFIYISDAAHLRSIFNSNKFLEGAVPVSIYFLGKIGSTELAAGGLAICIFHVAGLSIMAGLLTASDTLFPQVELIGCVHLETGENPRRSSLVMAISVTQSLSAHVRL
ncbi:hypothetical protein ACTXT7_000137 [Hymenolepis weldensis]